MDVRSIWTPSHASDKSRRAAYPSEPSDVHLGKDSRNVADLLGSSRFRLVFEYELQYLIVSKFPKQGDLCLARPVSGRQYDVRITVRYVGPLSFWQVTSIRVWEATIGLQPQSSALADAPMTSRVRRMFFGQAEILILFAKKQPHTAASYFRLMSV